MGRIKELRTKVQDGSVTPEEEAELTELETEATEEEADKVTEDEVSEEAVDKLADAIFAKVNAKTAETLNKVDKVLDAIDKNTTVEHTSGSGFIVDKKLGRVAVEKLEDIKIQVPGRKQAGKEVTEVSAKTLHFLHALTTNNVQKLQVLTEGTGAQGGFLVPEDFANMIVEDRRDATVMRQIAEQMSIQSDTLRLPRLDSRPQAAFRSEGAVKSTSTAQFSELTFTPYSLASIVPLTQELSDDATLGVNGNIVGYIGRLLVQALSEREDRAFWTGSGSGQPTGVSTYTLSSLSAGATDTAFADSIQRIYHRLGQGYRNSASWVAHRTVWERIATLKDANNNYLLRSLADGPTQVLKGRPIYEQNDLPQDELYFGDFSYYMIVDREGIRLDTSKEATVGGQNAFERNLVFVRAEERVDGELTLNEAIRKITDVTT